MPRSLWRAVRRTIPRGLIYGTGLQPLMIIVNLPPGALPQAVMKRAFGASSLWKKMIDWPLPKCTNSRVRSGGAASFQNLGVRMGLHDIFHTCPASNDLLGTHRHSGPNSQRWSLGCSSNPADMQWSFTSGFITNRSGRVIPLWSWRARRSDSMA